MPLPDKQLESLARWADRCPDSSFNTRSARSTIMQLVAEVLYLRKQLAEVNRFTQVK